MKTVKLSEKIIEDMVSANELFTGIIELIARAVKIKKRTWSELRKTYPDIDFENSSAQVNLETGCLEFPFEDEEESQNNR